MALRALVDRYAVHMDRGEHDVVAGLFVPDGTLTTSLPATAVGRDEIAASFASALQWFALSHGLDAARITTHHLVGNHVCELHGDEAAGITYGLARLCDLESDPPIAIVNVLVYEDRYAITQDGWRFRSRVINRLWTERSFVIV